MKERRRGRTGRRHELASHWGPGRRMETLRAASTTRHHGTVRGSCKTRGNPCLAFFQSARPGQPARQPSQAGCRNQRQRNDSLPRIVHHLDPGPVSEICSTGTRRWAARPARPQDSPGAAPNRLVWARRSRLWVVYKSGDPGLSSAHPSLFPPHPHSLAL